MNSFTKPPSRAWVPPRLWFTSRPMATMKRSCSVIWGQWRETEDTNKEAVEVSMEAERLPPLQDCRQHLDTEPCDNNETFGCSQWYHYSQTLVNFHKEKTKNIAHFVQLFYSNPHKTNFVRSPKMSPREIPVILFCYRDKQNLHFQCQFYLQK